MVSKSLFVKPSSITLIRLKVFASTVYLSFPFCPCLANISIGVSISDSDDNDNFACKLEFLESK